MHARNSLLLMCAVRTAVFRGIFRNATFAPSMDTPLSYPTAEQLKLLLYHSPPVNPYKDMAPLKRPSKNGGERVNSGMEGFTFSFAAKYRRELMAFVLSTLDAPPRFAVEVGSYLGAGATLT